MVSFFLRNVQSIIVAIIFIVIIEMLLPSGANKKYVKIVSGIYLIVTILNPFFKLFNKDFDLDFSKELESIETSSSSSPNLQEYYMTSLKETMKLELSELGFEIQSIDIRLSDDYSQIISILIRGARSNDEESIRKYIIENYSVENEKINFG